MTWVREVCDIPPCNIDLLNYDVVQHVGVRSSLWNEEMDHEVNTRFHTSGRFMTDANGSGIRFPKAATYALPFD